MRPAPSAEGAPDLPFESLLDTDTQAAPPPPQAPQASQPPQSRPATPDGAPQKATGSSAAETDGKASGKSDGETADKTTGKVTDKSTVKTANPAQPLPAEPPVDPIGDEATQTTGNITIVRTPDANKAVQAPVQAAVQPVVQTVDDAKTSDAANAIASAATPLAPKPGDANAKVDAKMDETTKAADTAKQADDTTADDKAAADAKATGGAKTAASPVPVIVATDPTAPPVQTTPEHATVIVPVTTEVSQIAPLAKQAAAAAPKPTAAPKTTAGEFAALQDGADKAAAARTHDETPAAGPHIATDKPAPVATDAEAALPKTTGDAVQQFSLPTPTPDLIQAVTPATAPAAPAPIAAPAAPVPIAGVAIEIATQAQAGKNHFEIRLDPPELGRIEVRLDVDRDGHVTSRLIADRSDTLNLLRNDAAGLQRALQDAGLKTTDNGLQFSLRDQSMNQQQNAAPSTPNTAQIVVQDSTLPAGEAAQRNYSRLAGLRGGIDIRV
jgi:flagellar hook-length control protein FliK